MKIKIYNDIQSASDKEICDQLASLICDGLPEAESKVWHAHPVWFLDGNPIVGYTKQKAGVRLMFWSGVRILYNYIPKKRATSFTGFLYIFSECRMDSLPL